MSKLIVRATRFKSERREADVIDHGPFGQQSAADRFAAECMGAGKADKIEILPAESEAQEPAHASTARRVVHFQQLIAAEASRKAGGS